MASVSTDEALARERWRREVLYDAKRSELERSVIEAAKAWRKVRYDLSSNADFLRANEIAAAVDALEAFEAAQNLGKQEVKQK